MKVFLPVLLLAMASRSEAQQLQPGQKILAGSLSFVSQNHDAANSYHSSNLSFSPSFSFVKNSKTIYGGFLSLGYSGQKNSNNQVPITTKGRSYSPGVGVFVQKLKWLNDKWFLYGEFGAQGGVGFEKVFNVENKNIQSKSRLWNAGVYITPGVSYRLTNKVLVDLRFNNLLGAFYSQQKVKQNELQVYNYTKAENFSVSSSLNNNTLGSIGVGFRWLLN